MHPKLVCVTMLPTNASKLRQQRHLGNVQESCSRGVKARVCLSHPRAQGSELLHCSLALIIIQVPLESILHGLQIHVWHGSRIFLLQAAADVLHQV